MAAGGGSKHRRRGYMPALDGVRALAVAAVLAYHAGLTWATGGFLGVDVFFVLSGFLITSVLLADHFGHDRVRLLRFWRRRARRLLPALALVLMAVSVAVPLVAPDQGWRLRGDLLGALAYFSNWRLIYQHQSYFQSIGRPPLLQHLWSLAVEEQFYLVWPVVLALALRLGVGLRRLGRLLITAAVASSALMAVLYRPELDPSRVYYGTDTRVAALLVGAALACLWPRLAVSRPRPGRRPLAARLALEVAGLAAVAALAVCVDTVDQYQVGLYRGGFLGVAAAAAVLVAAAAARPRTLVSRLLGIRPLVWLGLRSYAVYLWFWPVFMLTRPHTDVPLTGIPLVVLRVGITVALAAVSYRFVEEPIRSGAVGRAWQAWQHGRDRRAAAPAIAWGLAATVALTAIATGLVIHRRSSTPPALVAGGNLGVHRVTAAGSITPLPGTDAGGAPAGAGAAGTGPTEAGPAPVGAVAAPPTPSAPNTAGTTTAPQAAVPMAAPTGPAPAPARVTVIGESVLLELQDELAAALGDLTVDAAVGRQIGGTIAAVHALRDGGRLGEEAIVQVGNNGALTDGELDEMLDLLSGMRRVVIVNLRVPRPWEATNNDMLAAAVSRWPNTVLFDWNGLSAAHPDVFTDDGVHLRPYGVHLFARSIVAAL